MMSIHERYMSIALRLAARAEGQTSPNPMVGACVVKDGRIAGKGYHKRCGLAHAEVNAIKDAAGISLKGATLYVNLEPCNHFGRTPPCTEAIAGSGIKRVVIAMKDPNPINNGRGIAALKRRGIKVIVGVLEDDARFLNKPYIKFVTKRMPYVTVKVAESLDGKIATRTGDSKWVTSEDARAFVHVLRGKVDAVMVGANTVVRDDPLLISRSSKLRQPLRIVIAGANRIPFYFKIFSHTDISPLIVAKSRGKRVDLRKFLKSLAEIGIMHIVVEGGGELIASLVEEKLVDRFLFFIAPKIIGGRNAVSPVEGSGVAKVRQAVSLKNVRIERFKNDILVEAEVN